MGVVEARNDGQLTALSAPQPSFAVGHTGQFAERHAVDHGDGKGAYARFVLHIEDGTVHIEAVGIGPVEYQHALVVTGTLVHQLYHRYIIGVITQANILYIRDDEVNLFHRFIIGHATFGAVKRVNGHARFLIDRA